MDTPSDLMSPAYSIPVLHAEDFPVVSGANEGDPLCFAQNLELDDCYMLNPQAEMHTLALTRTASGHQIIAPETNTGRVGAQVHLDCTLSMMFAGGPVIEVLVLVEVDAMGHAQQIFMLPLAPLDPKIEYRLVGVDVDTVAQKFAQLSCVSFTSGTRITMGSGKRRPVETLKPGDTVLTRDDGVQKIKWIGKSTQRAVGAFAPIHISSGTLNNTSDLRVSPDHRLFVYQRRDELGAGRAELLVKARHLVNGSTVSVQTGGFVDYFQLLFDRHQIIYAEGIAAESMLVDDRTAPLLDAHVLDDLAPPPPNYRELSGLDVQKDLLDRPDAADVLRRASRG